MCLIMYLELWMVPYLSVISYSIQVHLGINLGGGGGQD